MKKKCKKKKNQKETKCSEQTNPLTEMIDS